MHALLLPAQGAKEGRRPVRLMRLHLHWMVTKMLQSVKCEACGHVGPVGCVHYCVPKLKTCEHRPTDQLYLLLLETEIEALRSVLAEFDGDKSEYNQMIKANAASEMRNHLRRPQ